MSVTIVSPGAEASTPQPADARAAIVVGSTVVDVVGAGVVAGAVVVVDGALVVDVVAVAAEVVAPVVVAVAAVVAG
jgi:hypothetical protein